MNVQDDDVGDNDVDGHSLLVLNWNVGGMTPKARSAVHTLIGFHRPDILTLQETKIHYEEEDTLFTAKNYQSYAMPSGYGKAQLMVRAGTQHVDVPVHSEWNDDIDIEVRDSDQNATYTITSPKGDVTEVDWDKWRTGRLQTKLYAAVVRVWTESRQYLVISHYRPQQGLFGGSSPDRLKELIAALHVSHPGHKLVYCGDINAHDPAWENSTYSDTLGRGINEWRLEEKWNVLSSGAITHRATSHSRGTSPDVIFGNAELDTADVDFWIDDLGGKTSDHLTMFVSIECGASLRETTKPKYVIRNGDNLDWIGWETCVERYCEYWMEHAGDVISHCLEQYVSVCGADASWDTEIARDIMNEHGIDKAFINDAIVNLLEAIV